MDKFFEIINAFFGELVEGVPKKKRLPFTLLSLLTLCCLLIFLRSAALALFTTTFLVLAAASLRLRVGKKMPNWFGNTVLISWSVFVLGWCSFGLYPYFQVFKLMKHGDVALQNGRPGISETNYALALEKGAGLPFAGGQRLQCFYRLGKVQFAQGKNDVAQSNLLAARDLAMQLQNHLLQAKGAILLADVVTLQGNDDLARSYYSEAWPIIMEAHDDDAEAQILRGLGSIAQLREDYTTASEYYSRAEPLFLKTHDRSGEGKLLADKAQVQQFLGSNDLAYQTAFASLRLFNEANNPYGQSHVLIIIAQMAVSDGKFESADRSYSEARGVSQKAGDMVGEGAATLGLAQLRLAQSELPEATSLAHSALEQFSKAGAKLCLSETYLVLGRLAQAQSDLKAARTNYLQARESCHALNNRIGEAHALRNLAEVDSHEAPELAIQEAGEAYQLMVQARYPLGQANMLYEMGRLQRMHGDPTMARNHLSQGLDLFRSGRQLSGQESCLLQLAFLDLSQRHYDACATNVYAALSICTNLKDKQGEGIANMLLGELHCVFGNYALGCEDFGRSRGLFQRIRDDFCEGDLEATWGKYALDIEHFEEAVEHLNRAVQIFARMGLKAEEELCQGLLKRARSKL